MDGIRRLIHEIHHRSLWQVPGVYLVGVPDGAEVDPARPAETEDAGASPAAPVPADADPELQPYAQDAPRRLASLAEETAGARP